LGKRSFQDMVELMARLRAPDGCPWDRAQDARSLRTYLLEETYEVLDAIERGNTQDLKEELGDLLLQVLFHSQIAREEGTFDIGDVLTHLHDKLVRRHPHVFGDVQADNPEQVLANWEELKAAERKENGQGEETDSHLNGVSRNLPALLEAYQLTRKAAQVGFDWEKPEDVLGKVEEETEELREALGAGEPEQIEREAGDLLFAAMNAARSAGVDPEIALRQTNKKFIARFESIERELARQGKKLGEVKLQELDALWERSKKNKEAI
jgi:tetrapyrrole methylase family protein/MazG family protein